MKHLLFAIAFVFTAPLIVNACVTLQEEKERSKSAAELKFAEENITVDAFWIKPPVLETEQFLRLEVRGTKSGELIKPPHDHSVSVWMKTHSYGLVEPTVSPALDASGKPLVGVYNVSGIYFLASGQWEVRVYLKNGKEPNPMQAFPVDMGPERANPMHDPKSPMHKMMNKPGGMDHSQHGHGHEHHHGADDKGEKKPKPEKKPTP